MDLLPTLIQEHFSALARPEAAADPIGEIVAALATGTLTKASRRPTLAAAGVSEDEMYRNAELDLVLSFIQAAVGANAFEVEQ